MEMVHFIPSSQRRLALLAAQADSAPVLICGATGTGKGAIAKWIHMNSVRANRPFLVANQGTSLVEPLAEAKDGTLFIPEIGECPLSEQKTLLNYLKAKTLSTHGDQNNDRSPGPARIIGSTNQTLEGRAQGGLFNIELLEKMNVFRIEMPSLCKRLDEFEDIVIGILVEIARELDKSTVYSLSQSAWEKLKKYDWPGNIRELRNVLRLALASVKDSQIESQHLPDFSSSPVDFQATREKFEKIYILELLKTFNWEIEKTCNMTRMDKSMLISKMKHYGISLQTESIS